MTTLRLMLYAVSSTIAFAAHAQTYPINDTGITGSGNAGVDVTPVNPIMCHEIHTVGQDCFYGRDAAAASGTLEKTGGGGAGFDFTKISNQGVPLPASAVRGDAADDWGCTLDNVTGLMWELKTTGGLRSQNQTYSWFDSASPDGNAGVVSAGNCKFEGRCDTEKFMQDVNEQGLCGFNDWRMPNVNELLSIVDFGRALPAIDPDYFPNTQSADFWSATPRPTEGRDISWFVSFGDGLVHSTGRDGELYVRLVRSAP